MALATRAGGMLGKQMRLWVDGYLIGNVVGGLNFEPARKEVSRDVYGDPNGIQMVSYGPGPQSIDIAENPNVSIVNELLGGVPSRNAAAPVLIRNSVSVTQHFAVVETLNPLLTGYKNGSTYLGYWAATLGTPKGDPGAEAIRTLAGPADVPIEAVRGGQFMSKRVSLTKVSFNWTGSWTGVVPLALADFSNHRAVYLEIQGGTGRDRIAVPVTVDDTNVQSSGSGGLITVPDTDVVDAAVGATVDAWVIFVHSAAGALQTHDCRWPVDA